MKLVFGAVKTMNLVVQGDSIPHGAGTVPEGPANSYTALYSSSGLTFHTVTLNNLAEDGTGISNVASQAATVDALFNAAKNLNVLYVATGINDVVGSADMTAVRTTYAAYCDARRTAGWYVVIGTLLPCDPALTNGGGNINTQSAAHNVFLKTWRGLHVDDYVDLRANIIVGPNTAPNDASLYNPVPNKIHPTNLAHSYLAADFALVMNRAHQ